MPLIDLDKARAVRREAKGEGPPVKIGGKRFHLPPELPYEVLEVIVGVEELPVAEQGAAVIRAAHLLMGDEAYKAFLAADPPPSVTDFEALIEGALEEYGLGEGQAASSRSSRRAAKRSRPRKPTSKGSTR